MDNIKVVNITDDDWQKFKTIRLESLETEPQAIHADYDDLKKFTEDDWRKEISSWEKGLKTMLFLTDGENLVGLVGVTFWKIPVFKHIARIFGFYLKKEYRGKGLGKRLIVELINYIKIKAHIRKIKLNVAATQTSAIKLYESLSFQITGRSKDDIYLEGEYFDSLDMEKFL